MWMTKVAVGSASEVYVDICKEKTIRVLHVDDDAGFLAVAKQCLEEQSQFEVDTALSAEEALKKLRDSEYDAVVTDYQMPGKNGLELLRELRQEGNDVPFILFTCKGKEEIAIEALNYGVYRYVRKEGNAEATYEELKRSICDAVRGQRAEKRVREAESRLRQITENMQDMLLLTDTNLICTFASASHKWILGYEPSEMVGKTVYDFIHPDDLAKAMEAAEKAFKDTSGGKMEVRVRRADGSYILSEGIGKILTDENGQITGIMFSSRDITERERARKALQESEEKYRELINGMNDTAWVIGFDGNFIDVNDAAVKVLGYSREELLRMGPPDIDNSLTKEQILDLIRNMPADHIQVFETAHTTKDGKTIPVEISSSLVTYQGKQAILSIARDITERKKAEQALSKSEEKYRKLFEEAMDAIFIADADTGILIDCNRAATALTGRAKSELIGMHQRFLHPPEENAGQFSKTFNQHCTSKKGGVLESKVITKNGEIKDVVIKANLFEVSGKKMLRGAFRDITESKKISEKNRLQARLLNAVGQAIVATDVEGSITYWNRAAEQLYGWQEAEVLGRNIVDVTPAETSKEQAMNIMNRLIEGEGWSGEFIAKRRDGLIFPAIVTNSPITDDKGEVIGIIGVSTDITEQKWMQEVFDDAIGKVVELNEKLRVVEGLTRHDLRNKLSALNGRLYLLKKRFGDNPEALQQLEEMESVSQQMLRIIEFEKIYVQVGAEELSSIDVERHLNEAVFLFSDLKGATLVNECHGLMALADSLLRQLFYNLIDNTLKYGKKTRRIRVHYKEEEKQLKLIYEDDGVGIPDDVKSNLFQKGYGTGTGYGLYLIKRICEAYGWEIEETGKEGQGAQFTMIIPKKRKDGNKGYEIS
jgi:PAS domain S-box-containing protein